MLYLKKFIIKKDAATSDNMVQKTKFKALQASFAPRTLSESAIIF